MILTPSATFAGSATWQANPVSGNWNRAANWTPATVPDGAGDTATFASSSTTNLTFSANTAVDRIVFNAGASAFAISVSPTSTLTISALITNNSGIIQNFVTAVDSSGHVGLIKFYGNATVGSGTFFTNNGGTHTDTGGGYIEFSGRSSAGNGTFINNGGAASGAEGGTAVFFSHSTASNGTFINNGSGTSGAAGGLTWFLGNHSNAGSATLIANDGVVGGKILFSYRSHGGMARVAVFGNGNLDISPHYLPRVFPHVQIGSLEGNGHVFLGSKNLTVGSNHLSTNFSGVIQDAPFGGRGGSLTKIGSGRLVFSHKNAYIGGTTISGGKLVINNKGGSGTGSGPVQVEGGSLGGKGVIAGAVTVGTGSGRGATLSPGYLHGAGSPGALTIQSALKFNSDSTYKVGLNSSNATADEVIANGVTINSGAQFSFTDIGNGVLTFGTVFPVINNTGATPIAGTFSNLADGSTFTSNGNTFKVNYNGADGNNLTLTVVAQSSNSTAKSN